MRWRKRPMRKVQVKRVDAVLVQLLLLAACYLAGLLIGPLWAGKVISDDNGELAAYLRSYLVLTEDGEQSFWRYLFLYFRYPLFAFFMGLTPIGIFFLPVLAFLQGFFLSYSVGSFSLALGQQGILLAAAGFGLRVLTVLPCFFCLAVQGFGRSLTDFMARRGIGKGSSAAGIRFLPTVICGALLFLGALLDFSVAPILLRIVRGFS